MNEWLSLLWSAIAGLLLGAIFFGGLWWTVRIGAASPRPALWFLGSSFLRLTLTVAGFYLVANGDWRRLVACLGGFAAARFLLVRLTRPRAETASHRSTEAKHAP